MRFLLLTAAALTCSATAIPACATSLLFKFDGIQVTYRPEPNLPAPGQFKSSLSFTVDSAGPYASVDGGGEFNAPETEQTFDGETELQSPAFLEVGASSHEYRIQTIANGRFLTLVFNTPLFSGNPISGYTLLPGTYGLSKISLDYDDAYFIESGSLSVTEVSSSPIASTVPEPSTLTLLGTGCFAFAGLVRRKLLSTEIGGPPEQR